MKALLSKEEHTVLASDEARGQYRELTEGVHTGKYLLVVEAVDGFELDDVAGLKSALGATRGEKETLETQLRDARGGADQLQARVDELEKIDPTTEADKLAGQKFESLKTQLSDQHAKDLGAANGKAEMYRGGLEDALIVSEAVQAITGRENKGSVKLLLSAVTSQCRIKEAVDAEGKTRFSVEVLDDQQAPRIRDAQANPFTILDLVNEMEKDPEFAPAFQGTDASGGGRPGDPPGTPPPQNQQNTLGDPTSKIERGLDAGQHQQPHAQAA